MLTKETEGITAAPSLGDDMQGLVVLEDVRCGMAGPDSMPTNFKRLTFAAVLREDVFRGTESGSLIFSLTSLGIGLLGSRCTVRVSKSFSAGSIGEVFVPRISSSICSPLLRHAPPPVTSREKVTVLPEEVVPLFSLDDPLANSFLFMGRPFQ